VNPPDKTFAANPAVLGAFVRAVATAGDSPTVVRRVAANSAYVYLCRAIVQLDKPGIPPLLQDACRAADIAPPRLLARLAPVAQALRLVPADHGDNYYKRLGVPPESDATIIRQAFRRRARDLHPDSQTEQTADPQAFSELTTAYQTLRDPTAKKAYDARRDPDGTWFEPAPQSKPTRRRRARFTAVIVVVVLLVAAALVLDHLYREHTRQSAYLSWPPETTRSVIPPPPPTTPPPAESLRVVESIPTAPVEAPATIATAPKPAVVSPEITPVVLSPEPSTTEAKPPSPAPAPIAPKPIVPPDRPTPAEDTRVADPRRVAIFYTSEKDGQLSEKLAALLADQGYPPPRIAQAPSERASNIRFFNTADHDEARSLRGTVRRFLAQATGRPGLPVRLKDLSRRYPRDDKGLLEVWINIRPPEKVPATTAPVTTTAAATTLLPAAAPPAPSTRADPVDERIRAFLEDYCRTYESRDPDRLASLFDTAATENGQPFVDLLPRYRANMARIERLVYRIEVDRWEPRTDTETLAVQGRFIADGQLTDQKHYHSQGTIVLDIVPYGESYRVARLTYQIDQEKKSD
jgi:DnaJ domain